MQEYSILPEQNSQIKATPTLLTTIQPLRTQLWLKLSLNQLQSGLNSCLVSFFTTSKQLAIPEAEVFQTL